MCFQSFSDLLVLHAVYSNSVFLAKSNIKRMIASPKISRIRRTVWLCGSWHLFVFYICWVVDPCVPNFKKCIVFSLPKKSVTTLPKLPLTGRASKSPCSWESKTELPQFLLFHRQRLWSSKLWKNRQEIVRRWKMVRISKYIVIQGANGFTNMNSFF